MTPSPIHARLRASTQELHDAVEDAVGLPERASTLDAYRAVLGRFWGFHAPLEAELGRRDWAGFDFAARRRAGRAQADLQRLGLTQAAVEALPQRPADPVASEAEALGVLYVLEGSTLGGRVIRRGVDALLEGEAASAVSFFDGRGDQGGRMWRGFLEVLNARVRTPGEQAEAQAGAEATFRGMIAWFS